MLSFFLSFFFVWPELAKSSSLMDDQHFQLFHKIEEGEKPTDEINVPTSQACHEHGKEVGRYNPKLALSSILC
jgi:hypothetical protein